MEKPSTVPDNIVHRHLYEPLSRLFDKRLPFFIALPRISSLVGDAKPSTLDRQKAEETVSPASHAIKRIATSRQPGMLLLKYVLVLAFVILGLVGVGFSAQSLKPPNVYRKDFVQEYLLGRAVLENVNPYLPIQELAESFIEPNSDMVAWHPTPHPPPVVLMGLPFGLLAYEQAATVWFFFEIACIFIAGYVLLRWLNKEFSLAFTAMLALLMLGWSHTVEELAIGQLTSLLLILLIGAWLALRSRKPIMAGALLGCIISLKLIVWPIILFLALRKNWRAVGAAGIVVVTTNVFASLLIGFDTTIYYYSEVGFKIARLFRAYEGNFSLWSIGRRLFVGTGTSGTGGLQAPPIVNAPIMAEFLTILLPLTALAIGLVLSTRTRNIDASFSILVCVSILINPVAWGFYLLLALVPITIAARSLANLDFPKRETLIALALGALLTLSGRELSGIAVLFNGQGTGADANAVSFITEFTMLGAQLIGVIGLIWLIWRLDRASIEKTLRKSTRAGEPRIFTQLIKGHSLPPSVPRAAFLTPTNHLSPHPSEPSPAPGQKAS